MIAGKKQNKKQTEYERLVQLKHEDRKVQAFELSSQLDILIKAIKDGDLRAYENAVAKDNMLPHYLYCNMFYPVHVACEFGRLEIV